MGVWAKIVVSLQPNTSGVHDKLAFGRTHRSGNVRMSTEYQGSVNVWSAQRLAHNQQPDSNTETFRIERQPGAVKLARVRRATAPGSEDAPANKAGKFTRLLASIRNRLPG